jgi:hypothetical protein
MADIFCPFKYSEKYTYCNCPYPGKEVTYGSEFQSIEQAKIDHIRELGDARRVLHGGLPFNEEKAKLLDSMTINKKLVEAYRKGKDE